jgi:hypothetical protein
MVACVLFVVPHAAVGQVHGVPASVTAIQYHVPPFLPNIRPSVTSLGPYGYGYNPSSLPRPYGVPRNLCPWGCRNRVSYGYGAGAYYAPIYAAVPFYDTSDPGPYLSSGPPSDTTLHIVVDAPPERHAAADQDDDDQVVMTAPPKRESDAKPLEVTVLVFRDGHRQEVSNYAIMGQIVYVFDNGRQKIGLGDLDVPATIRLNDDRGVDFHLPANSPS